MDKRIGAIATLVEDRQAAVPRVNRVLTEVGDIILGRIGVPCPDKGVNVNAVIAEGATDPVGGLSGKLDMIQGVRTNSLLLTKYPTPTGERAMTTHPVPSSPRSESRYRVQGPRLGLAAGLLFGATALGQAIEPDTSPDSAFTLDPLVITARGRESRMSLTPGGIGLLETDDLFEVQPFSISNAAARIPGVEKTSDSAWGSEMNIRGLSRSRVLFLIDGCRVNTATDKNAQYGLVDSNDVERVEVLKGPFSSLYGSGAIGGVVNVITRRATFTEQPEVHGEAGITYGSNPEGFSSFTNLSYATPDYWLYGSANWRDFDSYDDGDGDEIHNSQFTDYSFNLRGGYRWQDDSVTEAQVQRVTARDVGIPGGGAGVAFQDFQEVTYPSTYRTLVSVRHTLEPAPEVWTESSLMLFWQLVERRVDVRNIGRPPATPYLVHPEADHNTYGLNWTNHLQLGDHRLLGGIDVWQWHYDGDRQRYFQSGAVVTDHSLSESRQLSAGVFAEDDWAVADQWTLNYGGRIDFIEQHSDPLNARPETEIDETSWNAHVGATWEFAPQWSTTLIGAAGYRTPDLLDRFKFINLGGAGQILGNPDLDPERSLSVEYGLDHTRETVRAGASVFGTWVDDLILDPGPVGTVRTMENVQEARFYGVETDAEWKITPVWSVFANLAYVRGTDEDTDDDLPGVAPLNGLAGVAYEDDSGFHGEVELDWAAEQVNHAPTEPETDAWATVNLRLGYRFRHAGLDHEVLGAVDNLLDEDYVNHLSTSRTLELSEPGRNFRVTYRVKF